MPPGALLQLTAPDRTPRERSTHDSPAALDRVPHSVGRSARKCHASVPNRRQFSGDSGATFPGIRAHREMPATLTQTGALPRAPTRRFAPRGASRQQRPACSAPPGARHGGVARRRLAWCSSAFARAAQKRLGTTLCRDRHRYPSTRLYRGGRLPSHVISEPQRARQDSSRDRTHANGRPHGR